MYIADARPATNAIDASKDSCAAPPGALAVLSAVGYVLHSALPVPAISNLSADVRGPFSDQEALAGQVTTKPDFLFLDKNFLSFTGSFKVFDGLGANAYAGKGKIISVRNRRALYALGPDGSEILPAVAFIQKKLIGLRKTYEIYRYEPAYEGQVATEKDDDAGLPLYRYGWVQRALISFPTASYYYSADKGEKDPTPVLQAHERFNLNPFQPFMMDVTLPDESVGRSTTLATIGKALPRVLHFRRDASWAIEVAPGMDLVGMLCFALSVNQIMEDIEDENDKR